MISTPQLHEIITIILPKKDHFQRRIEALENAITAHPDETSLPFLKTLVETQQLSYLHIRETTFRQQEKPLFIQDKTQYYPIVQSIIAIMTDALQNETHNELLQQALQNLAQIEITTLSSYIDALFQSDFDAIPANYRLIISASLHVALYAHATNLTIDNQQILSDKESCPCCGMPPLSSVIDQSTNGQRYLSCSYCETKWHHVRSICTVCQSGKSLELITLEEAPFAMKAETCDECNIYIKHLDRTKRPNLDLFIEDILSLPLDLALNQESLHKHGVNLYIS